MVAIDYFTKCIKARSMQEISTNKLEKFTWKHLIWKYGLPYAIITDNNTQFKARAYEEFLLRLGVNHLVTFVEHPQINGQAKVANRDILKALRTRLDEFKEECPNILWAYHCSPQTTTKEGEPLTRSLFFQA